MLLDLPDDLYEEHRKQEVNEKEQIERSNSTEEKSGEIKEDRQLVCQRRWPTNRPHTV